MKKTYIFIIFFHIALVHPVSWKNWAGNQHCEAQYLYYPKTCDELIACIKTAATKGPIRVAGKGYSRSGLVCTEGCLIDLRYLNHILSIDTQKMQVCVQAGCTIASLNEYLASLNLALSNQAAVSEITIGGAVSTGVHGTGHTGTFSSFIVEIELIDALGNRHIISPNCEKEVFEAASMGLGAFGVIYSVTLQCEPLFYVRSNHTKIGFQYFIDHYQELHAVNDFFQAVWNVNDDEIMVHAWNRVDSTTVHKKNDMKNIQVGYDALSWFKVNDNIKDLAAEIAVPIHLLPMALEKTKLLIKKYQEQGLDDMATIVLRFAEQEKNALLSPTHDGPIAYINVGTPVDSRYLSFYKEFEYSLLRLNGYPHWGKVNFLDYQKVFKLYGNKFTTFVCVKKYFDPTNVFSNNYLNKLLLRI